MKNEITKIIAEDLLNPTFEMTRQYLKILEVVYDNEIPKIEKIEINELNERASGYVLVKDEGFYLEFSFDLKDEIVLSGVDTSSFIDVFYRPTSEELSLEQLLGLTTIKPTKEMKKGDTFSSGKFKFNYNGLSFDSYSGPGEFESKLDYLICNLEKDPIGVQKLIQNTDEKDIWVSIVYHNATGAFTGLSLNSDLTIRLSKLGLGLVFDIYAKGNKLYPNP